MDFRCPLAVAVVLAAAEKQCTTATAQNIEFGIEDIERFTLMASMAMADKQ